MGGAQQAMPVHQQYPPGIKSIVPEVVAASCHKYQ